MSHELTAVALNQYKVQSKMKQLGYEANSFGLIATIACLVHQIHYDQRVEKYIYKNPFLLDLMYSELSTLVGMYWCRMAAPSMRSDKIAPSCQKEDTDGVSTKAVPKLNASTLTYQSTIASNPVPLMKDTYHSHSSFVYDTVKIQEHQIFVSSVVTLKHTTIEAEHTNRQHGGTRMLCYSSKEPKHL